MVGMMTWNIPQSATILKHQSGEFCIYAFEDGMGQNIVLLHRYPGEQWQGVGGGDGQVWFGDFNQEGNVLGFLQWLQGILAEINKRIAAFLNIAPAPTVPTTFDQLPAWFKANLTMQGDEVKTK
jgi:hypothetical protein